MIEKLTDGGLNIWTTATNLTHWVEYISGTSTVNREATEKVEGDYSARLDVDANNSNVQVYEDISLTPLKRCKIVLWYMNSVAGKTGYFLLQDSGINVSLKTDGTWQAGGIPVTLSNSTVWKKYEVEFSVHADYSNYRFVLARSTAISSLVYFDKASIGEYPYGGSIFMTMDMKL